MTTPLPRESGLRYQRVANLLRDRIVQGHYQPGTRLPRLHDLAKETGVSFGTLKVALDLLEREGFLVRKVGQGTYAALPAETAAVALIIDGDFKFCSYLKEALSICGWDNIITNTGRDGIRCLMEKGIDLVLLDLVLPGMDGAQTFREIRKLNQDVPVVIVTGYPDSEIMSEALKVGPFAIVRKPFSLKQLSHIVERLFPGQAGLAGVRTHPLSESVAVSQITPATSSREVIR